MQWRWYCTFNEAVLCISTHDQFYAYLRTTNSVHIHVRGHSSHGSDSIIVQCRNCASRKHKGRSGEMHKTAPLFVIQALACCRNRRMESRRHGNKVHLAYTRSDPQGMRYPSFCFGQLCLACNVFHGDFARVRKTVASTWCDESYNSGPIGTHRLSELSLDVSIASLSRLSSIVSHAGVARASMRNGMECAEMESFPFVLLFLLRYRDLLRLSVSNTQLP